MNKVHQIFRIAALSLCIAAGTEQIKAQDTIAQGNCGANVSYVLYSDSTLTISGNGDMTSNPWNPSYRSQIKMVVIGDSVTTIERSAFAYCSNLSSVTIGNNVTSIGNDAFTGCSSLSSITIPNSVITIGGWAFWDCGNLISANIPSNVTSIGKHAFRNCSSLSSTINIPNGIITIEENTFENCSSLTSVTIPNSVKTIDMEAFAGCSGLTFVSIGNSVNSIRTWAFRNCSSLVSVTVQWIVPLNIDRYVFEGVTTSKVKLCVPKGTVNTYKSANYWKDFNVEECGDVSIAETHCNASVRVYPSPVKNQLTIDNGELTIGDYSIYSVVGQVVLSGETLRSLGTLKSVETDEITIDVSALSSGLYFLKIDGKTVKFIKE